MQIKATQEFRDWADGLSAYLRSALDERLDRIREYDHFGDAKNLGEGLFELRWVNGMRAYFGYVRGAEGRSVLMLLGGDKNGQKREIRKARNVLARHSR